MRGSIAAIALMVVASAGCATQQRSAETNAMPSPASTAIVVSAQPPEIALPKLPRTQAEASAMASALGAPLLAQCAAAALLCAALGGLGCVFTMPVACGAGAGASVAGAAFGATWPIETALTVSSAWSATFAPDQMNAALFDAVMASTGVRNEGSIAPSRNDEPATLEVGVKQAGVRVVEGRLQAFVLARARLVRKRDSAEIRASEYRFDGEPLTVAEWGSDTDIRVRQEVARAYRWLGEAIVDDVFLAFPFPDRKPLALGRLAHVFGLAPVAPPLDATRVDPGRAKFEWTAFPRDVDRQAAADEMSRVRDVRYELVVALASNGAPVDIVYRRDGLMKPEHVLEKPLVAEARYFWTVRAVFEIDGRPRATEWSTTTCCQATMPTALSSASYRFTTQ